MLASTGFDYQVDAKNDEDIIVSVNIVFYSLILQLLKPACTGNGRGQFQDITENVIMVFSARGAGK